MASIHSETEQIDYGKDAAIHFPAAVKDSANESSDHMTTVDTLDAMKEETCDQLEYVSSGIIHDESEKSNEAKPRKKRKEPDDDDESIQKKLKAPTFRIRRVGKTPKLEHEDTEHTETTVNQTGFKSKHDLKWDLMFDKLVEYKRKFNNAMVPQCYDQEPRLGRWVHYQRVEYWLYRSKGKAKITKDRIDRLEKLGFDWDPQKAQWEHMFEKLKAFQREKGHCRVPKGYPVDPNLANWVRNQRLEFTNLQKRKKTRMTEDRRLRLDSIGFRWSNTKFGEKSEDDRCQDLGISESIHKETKAHQSKMIATLSV